mmetsp:Transcript_4570/g.6490  ORF Transcript_4570/g.6490 Transcript_4570/m.6490 type:complete len:178 (-) Transcript_4570:26-559(-)
MAYASQAEWEAGVALRAKTKVTEAIIEKPAEKLRRRSRDRSYAKEIESLRETAQSLRIDDDWPEETPRYIQGGIIQEDNKPEIVYNLEDVKQWRTFVSKLRCYRNSMRCGHCYTLSAKPPLRTMAYCSRCRQTRYCSIDCQRADYSFHKTKCELHKKPDKSSKIPSTLSHDRSIIKS